MLRHPNSVRPRFQVEDFDGVVKHRTVSKSPGRPFEFKTVKEEDGWMVYFPAGHSLRIRKESEMIRLGFMDAPDLVDTNTGEIVPQVEMPSLKDEVRRKSAPSRSKAAKRQQLGQTQTAQVEAS